MHDHENQHVFDREYGLAELIETESLDALFGIAQETVAVDLHVFTRNGDLFYSSGSIDPEEKELCMEHFIRVTPDQPFELTSLNRSIVVLAVVHELETAGFLVVLCNRDADASVRQIAMIGSLLSNMLSRQMKERYKYLMTADLHGQVVEESYADLRHKTVKLEESEKKYRRLAESLEKEVKKQTAEIKHTQARLFQQEKLAAVGKLAAGIAHEINNPIGFVKSNLGTLHEYVSDIKTFIQAAVDLETCCNKHEAQLTALPELTNALNNLSGIGERIGLDAIMDDFSGIIAESKEGTNRVSKIVSDLKTFSSIDNPGRTFTDINSCIDNTVGIMTGALQTRAEIVKDLGDIPNIPCHRDQINQVLLNVLYNASDAAGDGGKIVIKTRTGKSPAPSVEISISDTGPGIPQEHINRIFEPFFTTREIGKGMGLGLSVARDLVRNHGGDIRADSHPGKGCNVIITLYGNSPDKG